MKRIVICSDGTWSTPDRESPTNVTRMAASMESLRARGGGEEATRQAGATTSAIPDTSTGAWASAEA